MSRAGENQLLAPVSQFGNPRSSLTPKPAQLLPEYIFTPGELIEMHRLQSSTTCGETLTLDWEARLAPAVGARRAGC